jgi:hypothetical protein
VVISKKCVVWECKITRYTYYIMCIMFTLSIKFKAIKCIITNLKFTFYKQNIKHTESQVICDLENNDPIWIIIVWMYTCSDIENMIFYKLATCISWAVFGGTIGGQHRFHCIFNFCLRTEIYEYSHMRPYQIDGETKSVVPLLLTARYLIHLATRNA